MHDDIQAEALRIIAEGESHGIVLRLLGGLAIRLHSPSAAHRGLERTYPDIDFATPAKRGADVEGLIAGLGYMPNKQFNLLNGSHRLLFFDQERARQIDVFVGRFEMCHALPITERLTLEAETLPLAELLLTKLQIVEMNDKDIRDVCALLLDHPVGDGDKETINRARIAELCGEDWGLWKTVTLSLDKVRARAGSYELGAEAQRVIEERITTLQQALADAPKSLRWKARAAIGERKQWYNLPEEVRRG